MSEENAIRRGHPLIRREHLTALLLHPELDGGQPGPSSDSRPSFFQVHRLSPSEVRVAVKGSCVYTDLKLIKLVSSSSSLGRPSGCPQGVHS